MAHSFQFPTNPPPSALSNLFPVSRSSFSSSNVLLRFQWHSCEKIRPSSYSQSPPGLCSLKSSPPAKFSGIKCSEKPIGKILRTCKICKTQFDPSLNHPRACRFHTAHFGGETKRKFESVYTGGTMSTPNSGQVFEYWHCCGSEDPFDPGCTAAPHSSYDD